MQTRTHPSNHQQREREREGGRERERERERRTHRRTRAHTHTSKGHRHLKTWDSSCCQQQPRARAHVPPTARSCCALATAPAAAPPPLVAVAQPRHLHQGFRPRLAPPAPRQPRPAPISPAAAATPFPPPRQLFGSHSQRAAGEGPHECCPAPAQSRLRVVGSADWPSLPCSPRPSPSGGESGLARGPESWASSSMTPLAETSPQSLLGPLVAATPPRSCHGPRSPARARPAAHRSAAPAMLYDRRALAPSGTPPHAVRSRRRQPAARGQAAWPTARPRRTASCA